MHPDAVKRVALTSLKLCGIRNTDGKDVAPHQTRPGEHSLAAEREKWTLVAVNTHSRGCLIMWSPWIPSPGRLVMAVVDVGKYVYFIISPFGNTGKSTAEPVPMPENGVD
jgi:hypothetical protein